MMKLDNIVLHEGGMKCLINYEMKVLIKQAAPGYHFYGLGKHAGRSEKANQPIPRNSLKKIKAPRNFEERLRMFREQYRSYENMLDRNHGLKKTIIKSYQ
ncbi:hypothetical protein GOV08_03765 [Candidatus Woesearchaeota archaeon]|nr:hypothetical protein [Candidatus Woesearchaeota archaeon]